MASFEKTRWSALAVSIALTPVLAVGTPGAAAPVAIQAVLTSASDYTCVDPGPRDEQDPDWFGDARWAYNHTIYPSERPEDGGPDEVMVNSAYVNFTFDQTTPKDGVVYLWLINENDDLVLGVENAAKSPGAFDPTLRPYLLDRKLGHPTLAVRFLENGRSVEGKGRIAGELYQIDGKWMIDNNSGRYSRGRTGDLELLLGRAAAVFEQHHIKVQCTLFAPLHTLTGTGLHNASAGRTDLTEVKLHDATLAVSKLQTHI